MEILRIDDENLKSIPANASCHLQRNPMKERNPVMEKHPKDIMSEFSAKYLLRALQALGIADDSVLESDLEDFASSLRHQMKLWIGDEETIVQIVSEASQVEFYDSQHWHKTCDALEKKLGIVRPHADSVPFQPAPDDELEIPCI